MYHKHTGETSSGFSSLRKQQIPQGPDRSSMSGSAGVGFSLESRTDDAAKLLRNSRDGRRGFTGTRKGGAYGTEGAGYPGQKGGPTRDGRPGEACVRPDRAVSTTGQAALPYSFEKALVSALLQ